MEMEEGYSATKRAKKSKRKMGVFCFLESEDKGRRTMWFKI